MPTVEDFLKVSIMLILWDVDWVCLAPDRKVWKASQKMMSLQVVQEAGKCVANGATVTGIFGGKKNCDFVC